MSLQETIRSSDEIARVLKNGRRLSTALLTVYITDPPFARPGEGRVAFIAGKRLGNAVVRNRAKRILRAAYTCSSQEVSPAFLRSNDILLIANRRTINGGARFVAKELLTLFHRAAHHKIR